MVASASARTSTKHWALLCVVLLLALILRWPGISERSPYFANEDEAHHYNRLVEMYKSGDLNPRYFHKPSLHFYLRLPVVALAAWLEKNRGGLRSAREIVTRDPYGLADYAFSASHPGILKWNRAFSVLLSLLLLFFTWRLARLVTQSDLGALLATSFAAFSPALVSYSPVIGVDIVMALFCILCAWLTARLLRNFSYIGLMLAGVCAGLAVSSKYNAGPVLVLPLAACYFAGRLEGRAVLISLVFPVLGFFLGSPFILINFDLFREHLAYEVWHYAVAGHAGHMAQPGVQQALFYLNWFKAEALGVVLTVLSLAGGVFMLLQRKNSQRSLNYLVLLFPALFFAMMAMQKTNFTRNMLVLIPFLSIFAAHFLISLTRSVILSQRASLTLLFVICLTALLGPLNISWNILLRNVRANDTRSQAYNWLRQEGKFFDTALAGQLQMSAEVFSLRGVSRINQDLVHPLDLYLSGFDLLVRGPQDPLATELANYTSERLRIAGSTQRDRIVIDPEIRIVEFQKGAALDEALQHHLISRPQPKLVFNFSGLTSTSCDVAGGSTSQSKAEGHCWLTSRRQVVTLRDLGLDSLSGHDKLNLVFLVMNPWPNQRAEFKMTHATMRLQWEGDDLNIFKEYRLPISVADLLASQEIEIELSEVHAPKTQGINSDARRLGIAIREIRVE